MYLLMSFVIHSQSRKSLSSCDFLVLSDQCVAGEKREGKGQKKTQEELDAAMDAYFDDPKTTAGADDGGAAGGREEAGREGEVAGEVVADEA